MIKISYPRRERIIDMVNMRSNGCTLQQIADKYGVSRQFVQQSILNFKKRDGKLREIPLYDCIYPNLKKWMIENEITLTELSEMVGLNSASTNSITSRLNGVRDFKISEVKTILEESGKTFEYMFMED